MYFPSAMGFSLSDLDEEKSQVAHGETAEETALALNARGEKVGVATLRLYRPFPAAELIAALPATTTSIAVLDRTKEPGSSGDPLLQEFVRGDGGVFLQRALDHRIHVGLAKERQRIAWPQIFIRMGHAHPMQGGLKLIVAPAFVRTT